MQEILVLFPAFLGCIAATCDPSTTKGFADYCNSQEYPKSVSYGSDCITWWWFGGADSRQAAVALCEKKGGTNCTTYDDNGAKCHRVTLPLKFKDWSTYCQQPLPKSWAMTFDGSFAWYDQTKNVTSRCSELSNKEGKDDCHLFDVNGGKCASTCQQYQPEWCWATAASEIATRIDYSLNRESHNCSGLECQVSGVQQHPSNPQLCCWNKTFGQACGIHGGTNQDIVNGISYLLKRNISHRFLMVSPQSEPISEQDLIRILNKGYSIAMGILWQDGGGHVLTLTGTDNNGNFYVHDPNYINGFNSAGHYQHLRFGQLLVYQPPYNYKEHAAWTNGVIIEEGNRSAANSHIQTDRLEGGGLLPNDDYDLMTV